MFPFDDVIMNADNDPDDDIILRVLLLLLMKKVHQQNEYDGKELKFDTGMNNYID